jgi:hypothetical protein
MSLSGGVNITSLSFLFPTIFPKFARNYQVLDAGLCIAAG